MKRFTYARGCWLLALVCTVMATFNARAQTVAAVPQREIIKVTEHLYRFRDTRHYGVFLVTNDGIVVVDPINADVATWLKGELRQRFSQPVRYVVYSHSHRDHVSGGEVFNDTATFVGQAAMLKNSQRPDATAPLNAREKLWDRNNDGLLQPEELRGGYCESDFKNLDRDGTGSLSHQELWACRFDDGIRLPDITYTDHLTLRLGGATVELKHLLPNHTDDMTLVWFPGERAIYTADFLTPNRLPLTNLDGGFLPGWVEALRQVEQVDFDIVVPAHEAPGTKAQVVEQRRYLEELVAQVKRYMRAGLSKEQIVQKVRMPAYAKLLEYEKSRAGNVQGAYEILSLEQK